MIHLCYNAEKEVLIMAIKTDRLTNLLAANKMSYQDLADITHINKATLHRYFTGATKKVPIERLWPIAFALNTTPQFLMGDTDNPDPSYCIEHVDSLHQRAISLINSLNDLELKSVIVFIEMLKKEAI